MIVCFTILLNSTYTVTVCLFFNRVEIAKALAIALSFASSCNEIFFLLSGFDEMELPSVSGMLSTWSPIGSFTSDQSKGAR